MTPKNLIKEKLEKILITNWTQLVELPDIISLIKDFANKNIENFKKTNNLTKKSQFSASRFELNDDKFTIWIEFNMPLNQTWIKGTFEFNLIIETEVIIPIDIEGEIYTTSNLR